MDKIVEDFKVRLKKALSLRNMKPSELAQITSISKSTISHYMSGYAKPKSDKLYTISKALDVSETWLMGYDVSMERINIRVKEHVIDTNSLKEDIDNLNTLLETFPEQTLKYLSQFCRKRRIDKDKTERTVARESHIPLKKYLDFEINHKNIGATNIMQLLNLLSQNPSYTLGYLTGALLAESNNTQTNILIDKISRDNISKDILKLLKNLSAEELDLFLEELNKSLPKDSDLSAINSDSIDMKNIISNNFSLNAAQARTDKASTPEDQKHDDAIMDDDKEWE